jgi:UDP-2-acetamido-2,6-beta-L-arabino-hexul-4-ose reductase
MMRKVLITGAEGFIGKNLRVSLQRLDGLEVNTFDRDDSETQLESYLAKADVIYHLTGVNRPQNEEEFEQVNAGFTRTIVYLLAKYRRTPLVVISSSTQAELDNPYGRSKKIAEDVLLDYAKKSGAGLCIFRLPNVFGKWSRPNYNSVVATFCYNISRGLDIEISDPVRELELVYIDDVVKSFIRVLSESQESGKCFYKVDRSFKITLGELADRIYQLKEIRGTLIVPDSSDLFMKYLYATYLSFLDKHDFSYGLELKSDQRGNLAELIKSRQSGQIFVSTSHPGIKRGNHYHDTKIEKFIVLKGSALIKFRHIVTDEVLSYPVSGQKLEVVDIPPGYTHSIENSGDEELVVLFWANEIFDPDQPDTFYREV